MIECARRDEWDLLLSMLVAARPATWLFLKKPWGSFADISI
jgi:hypothetical protein